MRSAAMKGTTAMRGDRLNQMTLTVAFALLGGCALVEGPGSMATTGVSAALLINTGKTITDHVLSYAIDEDCSMVNYEKTRHYCREWPEVTVRPEPELYCYKTLAQIECHTRPEPYGNKETLVGIRPAWPAPETPPK
jgi:hypothetical protein